MTNLNQNFQQQAIAKALEDEAFQQQLLLNPKAAMQTLGLTIPESIELQVLQETDSRVYLVLPHKPSTNKTNELCEEELEAVAGGRICAGYMITNCFPTGDECGSWL